MNSQTLNLLRKLHDKFEAGPFGKVAQKLLALSFNELGFTHIVERSVEGVDIDVSGQMGKFALEVKTTEGSSINLSSENIDGLRKRVKDGYIPIIAALRLAPLERWICARIPLNELSPGQISIHRLRAYRLPDMESLLTPAFEQVVKEHCQGTLKGGQQYLNEQLKKTGIDVRES